VPEQNVIHKVVFDLGVTDNPDLVQSFHVPSDAVLVAVDWDTRNSLGIALWYVRHTVTSWTEAPPWRVMVRGTGDPFPTTAGYLATVVRGGFAWHLLDADGDRIRGTR